MKETHAIGETRLRSYVSVKIDFTRGIAIRFDEWKDTEIRRYSPYFRVNRGKVPLLNISFSPATGIIVNTRFQGFFTKTSG